MNTLIKSLYVLFFLCFVVAVQAQEFPSEEMVPADHSNTIWWKETQATVPNVLKAEKAYKDYFKEHGYEESKLRSIFRRWLDDARLSMDQAGNHLPNPYPPSAYLPQPNNSESAGTWQAIGPNFAEKTKCGTSSDLSGGFCDRVYINPYNNNNLFAGFSYGGLWVSQDQGDSWTLSDGDLPNGTNTYANRDLYYGEIEASVINSSLVYAATEYALLKSTNSGMDWTVCPQLNREAAGNTRSYYVALSKVDANIVLATFGRQVFRSTDGGTTWTVVFDNSNGGSNHHYTSQYSNNSTFGIYDRTYNFFGLESAEGGQDVFYLGVWNNQEQPEVYQSTDGGQSFELLVDLNTDLGRNLPSNLVLLSKQNQANEFYVHSLFTYDSLYHYQANGQLLNRSLIDAQVVTFGTEVKSLEAFAINPADESEMYAGFYFASAITKSTNGGNTFIDQTSGYSACPKYVHPDVRSIDVQGELILIGSDGGLAISKDAMTTVSSDIGREISAIDLWGFTSSPKTDFIAVGCDHGPTKVRRFAGENGWTSLGGGDASDLSINSSNEEYLVYDRAIGSQFIGQFDASNNLQTNSSINNDISLNQVAFHPYVYINAYAIEDNKLIHTTDNFMSISTLTTFGSNINVARIAPDNPDYLYVLTNDANLRKSIDGGNNWTVITPPNSVTNGQTNIRDIVVGENEQEIWVAYGNWQNEVKILKSTDAGSTWENITTDNLPVTPVSQIAYQPGTNGGIYMAFGGMSGVWYRNNSMSQWEALGTGFPSVGYIRNIFPVPNKGKLRVGTSRGVWEHDLYEASAPVANFALFSNIWACGIPLQMVQNSTHAAGEVSYSWSFPGGIPLSSTDAAPAVGYAQSGQYDISLTITDANGQSATQSISSFINILDGPNCITTNTKEIVLEEVNVYPIPSHKSVAIELPQREAQLFVQIVNTSGQIVYQTSFKNKMRFDLDISKLTAGIYFLEIQGEKRYKQTKIVK